MENLRRLMALIKTTSQVEASERFDKQALLKVHDLGSEIMQLIRTLQESATESHLSVADPISSSGSASKIPVERLNRISLTQLQIGQVHRGRVLYGTLCAEAFRIRGIMTLLEDNNGLAVRLTIYNAAHSETNIKRLYPRGAKVAIREPYFNRYDNGCLAIRVDNPANVEMLVTQEEQRAESLAHVDMEEMRTNGNTCFREKQWDAAAEHYTKCIDAALLQLYKIKTCLLLGYSNRAETRLQMKEFERALEDSDKALRIDSCNLKALYRKGRALVDLRQYAGACECLEKADKARPGQKQIEDALRRAKTLYAQSRNGKYDISDYLLGRGSSTPEVADFMGPVEIKMTKDGRGRGLYAKREISTGQLLLVSNAVAVTSEDGRRGSLTVLNADYRSELNMPSQNNFVDAVVRIALESQNDLVDTVVGAAMKSQILLRQLYSLDNSSAPGSLDVPAIDLFKRDGQLSRRQEEEKENLQVDVKRIRDIISRNSFGGRKVAHRGQCFSGLWLLPSFINHSCLPNSSRLEVGSALFIHASKPIERGEEIIISYFDTLVPFSHRQAMCRSWGFECKCRRCILELSLKEALEPITARFEQLRNKALEEIIAASSQTHFGMDLPACAEFAKLFGEIEKIIASSTLLKTEEEKNWIRASFVSAHLAGTLTNNFFPTTLTDCVPSRRKVMEAIQNTVPGDIRTLVMAAQQLKEANCWKGIGSQAFITQHASEQARETCIRVFGRHSEDLLKALISWYESHHLF